MTDSNSPNALREIIDQTTSAMTDPAFGKRSLDLGNVSTSSPSSTSPLVSSLNSIPSYTPPDQNGGGGGTSGFTPAPVSNPGANLPNIPTGGLKSNSSSNVPSNIPIAGGISGLSNNSPFSFSLGGSSAPLSNPMSYTPMQSFMSPSDVANGTGGSFGGGGVLTSGGFGEGGFDFTA